MTPERWQQLEALYDAAVDLSPPERAHFLDEQCRGDEVLLRELTAMFRDTGSGISDLVGRAAAVLAGVPWVHHLHSPATAETTTRRAT